MPVKKKLEEQENGGSGREPRRAALADSGAEEGYARVSGQRLRYAHLKGTGTPLLLCNGVGANLELALPLARAVFDAGGAPVVLFDLPGIGRSPPGRSLPGLRHYARLAVGLLDALGYSGSFAVGGVSWGGALAQRIARDYPARVRGLVLMATSPGILMVPGRPGALVRMITPRRYLSRRYMARNAAAIYGGEMRGRPDLAADFARLTHAPTPGGYLQQLLSVLTFSSLPWLHRVECPALVMGGDDDPLVRPINLRVLAALLPQAQLHIVPRGGHLFMVMRPRETAGRIAEFLKTCQAG
jgi:poly(3-hydroxyoctanoate) depolymerase